MDQNHFTTDTLRKKGAHLTFEERVIIQTSPRQAIVSEHSSEIEVSIYQRR